MTLLSPNLPSFNRTNTFYIFGIMLIFLRSDNLYTFSGLNDEIFSTISIKIVKYD